MKIPTLESWRLDMGCIRGNVSGSAKFKDGERIMTSRVVSVRGNVVSTENGSKYRLGKPREDHVAIVAGYGFPYTEADPMAFWKAIAKQQRAPGGSR